MAMDQPDRKRRDPAASGGKAPQKEHKDEKLEEALEESFPASDPVDLTPHKEEPKPSDRTARKNKAGQAGGAGRKV